MSKQKRYSEHICVSSVVKKYFQKDCKDKFLEMHPELEGTIITHDQIQRALIKSYLGIFSLENDQHDELNN